MGGSNAVSSHMGKVRGGGWAPLADICHWRAPRVNASQPAHWNVYKNVLTFSDVHQL